MNNDWMDISVPIHTAFHSGLPTAMVRQPVQSYAKQEK